MIILLHYLGILLIEMLKSRKRLKLDTDIVPDDENHEDLERRLENKIKFDPPLYRQRYAEIYNILIKEYWRNNVTKLVDFGCSEYGLFIFIKSLNIADILFVDIDEDLLVDKINYVQPLLYEHLNRRSTPLNVTVLKGSVSQPDYRLRKTDVITAIELIEHLYPDTLDALPYNLFTFIRPKLIIITTPNADFNVIFQRKNNEFRHPDHKFEWTREQFENWSTNLIERFPDYTVEFKGLGDPPLNADNIGSCTQLALFTRKDVIDNSYISSSNLKSCKCDPMSPCNSTSKTGYKLLCRCLCEFCVPDFSVGVCTYQASFQVELDSSANESYNIYYKLLKNIEFPYEIDARSENDKLLDLLKYRISMYSHTRSRFYVESKDCCEIPIINLLYGDDFNVTVEEISKLLSTHNYVVEECVIEETEEIKLCVITMPYNMENNITSSSENDNFSVKSECTDIDNYSSDWDAISILPNETNESTSDEVKKPNSDPLFDSGYLQSPLRDNPELLETDLFEKISTIPETDRKNNDKKTVVSNKQKAPIPLDFENKRRLPDPNKVNELDRFGNMSFFKTFGSSARKDSPSSPSPPPIPGSSSSSSSSYSKWKKKKFKDKKSIEFKEPTSLDDAKSLTNCIVENSLNSIIVQESQFIAELSPSSEDEAEPEVRQEVVQEAANRHPLVENGDLANNNRDNEGNNYNGELDIDEGIDLLVNDNFDEANPLVIENNLNIIENNNEIEAEENPNHLEENFQDAAAAAVPAVEAFPEIGQASKEVLYDENSQQDSLEDWDIPPQLDSNNPNAVFDRQGGSAIFIGMQPISSNISQRSAATGGQIIPIINNDGIDAAVQDAHFYCQGDGVGVHPSIIAVEVNDAADEADADSTTSTASSNNTLDYAEVDPGAGASELFDMSSLTEDELSRVTNNIVPQAVESDRSLALVNEVIKIAEETVNNLKSSDTITDINESSANQSSFSSGASSSSSSENGHSLRLENAEPKEDFSQTSNGVSTSTNISTSSRFEEAENSNNESQDEYYDTGTEEF